MSVLCIRLRSVCVGACVRVRIHLLNLRIDRAVPTPPKSPDGLAKPPGIAEREVGLKSEGERVKMWRERVVGGDSVSLVPSGLGTAPTGPSG